MASETLTHGERMKSAATLREQGLKLCNGPCGQVLPLDAFFWRDSPTSCNKRPNSRCKECMNMYGRERYAELREQVIALYGGACVACGDTRVLALDLDHIYNDGAIERAIVKQDHNWLKTLFSMDRRPDIQILCGSCHAIKTRGGDPAEIGR